jgi:hypothetical protein
MHSRDGRLPHVELKSELDRLQARAPGLVSRIKNIVRICMVKGVSCKRGERRLDLCVLVID